MKRVVVTGLGAVTPLGNNVPDTWDAMLRGVNGIDTITRFDVSESKYKFAGELKGFDPLTVMDKASVRKTDRFTQYALAAAQEAVNDSTLDCAEENDRMGVYFGSGIGGFETFEENEVALLQHGPRKVSPHFIPKMIANIAAGQIAIRFKATGPCIAVTTACATASTAIGEAFRAIRHGYADIIVAGGSEAAIVPLALAGFGNCKALSAAENRDEASLPFDARRGGFVMGEGAAALILEEYEHAVARGAKIYAEICGYGSTCDAYHVTAPSPDAKSITNAIHQAMEGQDVDASRIYINAHGTGTHLNDMTETKAFKAAFGDDAYKLHISSTKSMTGHMLGAAGAIEAIAAIKALGSNMIPPTINLKEPDPELDLNYTPNTAVETELDLALSTNLGFGGHNACLAFKKC